MKLQREVTVLHVVGALREDAPNDWIKRANAVYVRKYRGPGHYPKKWQRLREKFMC